MMINAIARWGHNFLIVALGLMTIAVLFQAR